MSRPEAAGGHCVAPRRPAGGVAVTQTRGGRRQAVAAAARRAASSRERSRAVAWAVRRRGVWPRCWRCTHDSLPGAPAAC